MKKKLIIIGSIVFAVIAITITIVILFGGSSEVLKKDEVPKSEDDYVPIVKELNILDLDSNTRPIAVMINNHSTAQPYQSGLNEAYLVYEIIVEGGISRMMAVYKDSDAERIGSVRSSRHYFLDYAMENDALYAHHGWSPQAQSDISSLGINNLHGNHYWRESLPIAYEHTMFTNIANLWEDAARYGYRVTSDSDTLLEYDVDSIKLNRMEGAVEVSSVTTSYSTSQTNKWVYNSETMLFEKYSNGTLRVDYVTKEAVSTKNIIAYQINNYSIDSYGRQNIDNVGSGSGYFISEGYSIPITWNKDSRSGQTKYYYTDGSELIVNDGITHIQIVPNTGYIQLEEVIEQVVE